jgi:hypothetical protein
MSFFPATLGMSAGAIIWAAHFTALYGYTALACARGLETSVPWVAALATAAALVAMAWIGLRALPHRREFIGWMTLAIAGLALVGVVYETVPLFIVPLCA